jgi:hypothetical protein
LGLSWGTAPVYRLKWFYVMLNADRGGFYAPFQ